MNGRTDAVDEDVESGALDFGIGHDITFSGSQENVDAHSVVALRDLNAFAKQELDLRLHRADGQHVQCTAHRFRPPVEIPKVRQGDHLIKVNQIKSIFFPVEYSFPKFNSSRINHHN